MLRREEGVHQCVEERSTLEENKAIDKTWYTQNDGEEEKEEVALVNQLTDKRDRLRLEEAAASK